MKNLTLSIIVLVAGLCISLNLKCQNSNLANIDEFILEKMGTFHVPGLSAVIIKGDSVVWNNNYGYMNLQNSIPVSDSTLFTVFSIGKSITAACIMQLWDDGLLGLDQNINDFLPFQMVNPWNNADSITARMLMSHSSGIKNGNIYNYVSVGDPTIGLGYFLENFLSGGGIYYNNNNYWNMQPGTQFHYDNYGPALTGYLVEPLTGISFSQYAQDSLLAPLEMDKSAWFLAELNLNNLATGYTWSGGNFTFVPHYGHPAYPGMSLRSSALELANFTIMLLNDGFFKGTPVLSNAVVDSMTTMQNPDCVFTYGRPGLGLFRRTDYGDRTVWGHNGGSDGGYANHFYFCKEENSGIVITTNSEQYVDPIVLQLFEYAGLFVIANPANDITSSSFQATWESASIATGYLLDVALDDEFINFVGGYENMNVGLVTGYYVSGLEPETEYFYRLRAFNVADTGAHSNVISLTTCSNSCLPEGITFTSQEQIDNFQINYPGCAEIEGDVTIEGADITNLNGLSVLTSIGGNLLITENGALTNLTGLENLTSIGDYSFGFGWGNLEITHNHSLTNLTGLEGLVSIGGDINIYCNDSLISLNGLEGLTDIPGNVMIGYFTTMGISCGNPMLTTLTGLDNLTKIGGNLTIWWTNSLNNLTGLDNLDSIGGDLIIRHQVMNSLIGLESLTTIEGYLEIGFNDSLTSLTGLDNLFSIGEHLLIHENSAITNLTGLDNLGSLGGELDILFNNSLTSLTGLDNIAASSITNLYIGNNSSLFTCEVTSICEYLAAPNGTVTISNNAPGCNSQAQVIAACEAIGIEETIAESGFSISPNPFTGYLTIEFNLPQTSTVSIQIFNAMGAKVAELYHSQLPAGQKQFMWDAGDLPKGLYLCRVQAGNEMKTQKIIKIQ